MIQYFKNNSADAQGKRQQVSTTLQYTGEVGNTPIAMHQNKVGMHQ